MVSISDLTRPKASTQVKLNLGCGEYPLEKPFMNIDRRRPDIVGEDDRRFICHDLVEGIPFPDAMIDSIVCHHFLEHLTYPQAEELIKECARVLKPGGLLSLVTPDFEWLTREYLSDAERLAPMAELMLFCEGPDGDKHRSAWDQKLLAGLVERHGFAVSEREVDLIPYLVAHVVWQTGVMASKK